MRILMVGAGATGGYYGGRLAEAGRDVTFLLRDRRAAQVRAEGLRITSPRGDATLQPKIVTADELRTGGTHFDVILLSVKAYSLESAVADIAPAVGPQTRIVPILNGMRHLDVLTERFGAERVLGGSVRIIVDMAETGELIHSTPLAELTVGLLPGVVDQTTIEVLREELTVPDFDLVVADDVIDAMWQKWWLLASMNAVCILANGTIAEAATAPHGSAFTSAVLQECLDVAAANGHAARPALIAEMRDRYSGSSWKITSSMFRDLQRSQPVEADQIFGDFLARAGGVPVPLLTAAYVRLKVYEAGRS